MTNAFVNLMFLLLLVACSHI